MRCVELRSSGVGATSRADCSELSGASGALHCGSLFGADFPIDPSLSRLKAPDPQRADLKLTYRVIGWARLQVEPTEGATGNSENKLGLPASQLEHNIVFVVLASHVIE